jgi:hypothetical protein
MAELNRTQRFVHDYLAAMERTELRPGSAEWLCRQPFVTGEPAEALGRLHAFLDGPNGAGFWDPDGFGPATDDPVRTALGRLGFLLKPGVVEQLTDLWGVELAGLGDPGSIAAAACRKLSLRENHRFLKDPPPLPPIERKVARALAPYAAHLTPQALAELPEKWARGFLNVPDGEIERIIALRLSNPGNAPYSRSGVPIVLPTAGPDGPRPSEVDPAVLKAELRGSGRYDV